MMHSPSVSDTPYFRTLMTIFKILPFPEKFLNFHPPKFLMTFLEFPRYFRCCSTFTPCFSKVIIPPYFDKFHPPVIHKFTCCLHALRAFRFPPTFNMMH